MVNAMTFLANYLALILLVAGVLWLLGGTLWARVRARRLSAMGKRWIFFFRSLGFWSLVIGGFMVAEKVLIER